MRGHRLGPALAVAAVVALAAEPVAAHASTDEAVLQGLNTTLLYVAIPITIAVEALLLYAVWRFRGSHEPTPTGESRQLEIGWTLATAVVLVFVGVASYQVLGSPYVAGAHGGTGGASADAMSPEYPGGQAPAEPDALEVEAVAYRYGWTFRYPAANVTTNDSLVLPTDRPIYIHVTAENWLHSLHVPGLGLKQDAFPGQYNTIRTRLFDRGEYRLYCAEYCGVGHATMHATVDVRSPSRFQTWLDSRGTGSEGPTATATGPNATATAA